MKYAIFTLTLLNSYLLFLTLKKQKNMADNIDDLALEVKDLRGTVNTLQDKVTTAVDALNLSVKDLKDQIANMPPGADKDKIMAISADIQDIKADLESTDLDGTDTPPTT